MAIALEHQPLVTGPFPCHPAIPRPRSSSRWLCCPDCASRVRNEGILEISYGNDYPVARGHHNPRIGRCKVETLRCWLAELEISVKGQIVCEIGFGGGDCLGMLQNQGATVFGLEPVPANRARAQSLGVPAEQLFDANPLPELSRKVNLWLFQDSFEHIPDPNRLVEWVRRESAPGARVLLVAPDADSVSRKLMASFWLYNSPDHFVHYTPAGIATIFGRAGFGIIRRFRPLKLLSPAMAWKYLRVLMRMPAAVDNLSAGGFSIWFNIGAMGLLLQRNDG